MRPTLVSLALGGAVGGAYGLCGVRSPAPPLVHRRIRKVYLPDAPSRCTTSRPTALAGLLGTVGGEALVAYVRARW